MRRRLFAILTLLSLLLCAAVCALWVRSYRVADTLAWQHWGPGRAGLDISRYECSVYCGSVVLIDERITAYNPPPPGPVDVQIVPASGLAYEAVPLRYGIEFWRPLYVSSCLTTNRPGYRHTAAVFPAWVIAAPLGAPLALWVIRTSRKRRFNSRLCPACGYDLRATPDRCPECGTAAAGAG